jgi:hypothetical protein
MSTQLESRPRARRLFRRAVSLAGFLAVPFAAGIGAIAPSSGGIVGFSGRQGSICSYCHSGGVVPTVALEGPVYVLHDSTRTFTFRVSGGQQVAAGLDVSVGRGMLVATDSQTRIQTGELTHNSPRLVNGSGEAVWSFDYVAPTAVGQARMWAAGNSVNLDATNGGDAPASTILTMQVVANLVRFTEYGSGLAGSGGFVPRFTGTDGPAIGPWSASIADGLGGATAFVFVGQASGTQPLFGGTLWIDLAMPWTLASFQLGGASGVPGVGSLTIPGDNVSTLAPFTYYAQCLVADPAAPRGFAFSNALEIDIEK